MAAAPASAPPDVSHTQWQLVENYCFECHNATDWAGGVAFDTMSADGVPEDAKVWEAAIKKLKSGLMPPPGNKQPERAAVAGMVSWLESTLDKAQATPYAGYVPLRRLNRREYANAVRDLLGLRIDAATWLPQDPLKDDFDTNAELLQVTPAFMDQAVTAARALALQAVGDPKSVPLETTYGPPANMILSLAAAPALGSGNQQRYKDGMPFGTRGGMSVEHNFPADGEYVLTIGDMALARTVPNMEFENTVIALLDGKEFWRTQLGGEEDHKAIDQKLDDAVARINGRLKDIRFRATAGQHTVAVTFLRRSYAEDDGRTLQFQAGDDRRAANLLEGGQHRVQAVHAFHIKGPVKITGMSDSPTRQKIFICKPASAADEKPCAREDRQQPGAARLPPPGEGRGHRPTDALLRPRQQDATASRPACVNLWLRSWRARTSCTAPRRRWTKAPAHSTTSNWPRACPSSCGAACRTTSCWPLRRRTSCRNQTCWRHRCAG